MDALDVMLSWLPSVTDFVIYGAMASAAAAIFAISFFGIVGTFYRDSHPLLPATRALAAALALMPPLAVLLMVVFAVAESQGLYMVYTFSTARLLGSLCGTPLLLWPAAVALTAYPPFRDAHMPAHPAAEPAKEEKTELTAAQAEASEAGAAAPPPTSAEERGPSAAQQAAEPAQQEQEAAEGQAVPTDPKKEL